jgi:taurine--2-oxoglutarate transaminase
MIATSPKKDNREFRVLTPWSRQSAPQLPALVRGEGVFLFDTHGNRLLDLSSGLVSVNLGHGNAAIISAVNGQISRLAYASPQFPVQERSELAVRLSDLTPWSNGGRVFFTTGGGEANQDAVKMARTITGRQKVLSAYRSFHGSSQGAGTLTGENRRWPNEPGIPGVVHFITPFPYRSPFHADDPVTETSRALDHLEFVLTYEGPRQIAAIILEPVVGTNGVVIYPDGYLAGIRKLCDRYGILLIFDEVMTGFGRTGAAFACTRFGILPDIITVAKGLTSAYVPLGAVLVREEFASYFDDHVLGCGHTYSGHPVSVAAALAALNEYERGGLYERGLLIEKWLEEELRQIQDACELVGDIRGLGAFFAIELVRDRNSREPITPWQGEDPGPLPHLLKLLRQHGVVAFGRYNIILIAPPLIIQRDELHTGMQGVAQALQTFEKSFRIGVKL